MRNPRYFFAFSFIPLLLLLIFVPGCTVEEKPAEKLYTPPELKNDGWNTSTLAAEGVNPGFIEDLLGKIEGGYYSGIHGLVMVRNGKLILDESWKQHLTVVDSYVDNRDLEVHAMMSVTKSIVSLLMGIAIERGFVGGKMDPVYSYFPEYSDFKNWNNRKERVTIKNFLTMRHGLEWDETTYKYSDPRNTYNLMEKTNDWVKFTLDRELNILPGTIFAYSTGASHTLEALISNASGFSFPEFARRYLFESLGIQKRAWFKAPNGRADDVYLTIRDMAKFGQLVLDNGQWRGVQLVPGNWVYESTQRIVNASEQYGYSYFWWHRMFQVQGKYFRAVIAWGYGGQFIFIIRDLNLVVCFTSGNYTNDLSTQPFDMIRQYIIPSFL